PEDEKYTLPGFSILIAIVLTIICLAAFIYFIHNMSQSIQINNILDTIFVKSKKRLNLLIDKEAQDGLDIIESFPEVKDWHTYTTHQSGYFQNISLKNVITICKAYDTKAYLSIPKGFYVQHHIPFLHTEKPLPDDVVEKLFSNINYSRSEFVEDNYVLAFKQITEIILKAMSPGINDPGTAINAIDYLTELLALRMKKNDSGVMVVEGEVHVRIAIVSFEELLYNVMAALRTYCAHDPLLVQKMIWMLAYLKDREEVSSESYIEAINNELAIVTQAAMDNISNKTDLETIEKMSNNVS
ncbi:MAG: DUF2254 domain-containing protein, partial [Flavobacteriaceae bacterium]|nr:DUF2254 domain-containing protein [Flavobacteriaceae bacterium]